MARRRIHRQSTGIGEEGQGTLHTPLDRGRITATVVRLLQEEGIERLSMRKIADSLGVKAAALYYHVKDKEHLLHLLAERISEEAEIPEASLPWRERLRLWAIGFRRALLRYRDGAAIMNATVAATPRRLAHIEFLYRLMAEAGFADAHVPWLASMIKNYVFGFADEENRLTGRAEREAAGMEEWSGSNAERFRKLADEGYPHFARLAPFTVSADWDTEFLFGIDVLLDGFEARLPR